MPKGKNKGGGKPRGDGKGKGEPSQRGEPSKGAPAAATDEIAAASGEMTARGVEIAEPMREATQELGSSSLVLANLPSTRAELLALHATVRRRRNSAELGGSDYRAAAAEIARIEVEIARIERAMDPPLG
jgi:hypothetical protein